MQTQLRALARRIELGRPQTAGSTEFGGGAVTRRRRRGRDDAVDRQQSSDSPQMPPKRTTRPSTAMPLPTSNRTFSTASDGDHYAVTLADYEETEVHVEHHNTYLGPVTVEVTPDGDTLGPTSVVQSVASDGIRYRALLPPGRHVFRVSSTMAQPYNVKLRTVTTGLQPDRFENNDTLASAQELPPGEHLVNLHTAGDVDHYLISTPLPAPPNLGATIALSELSGLRVEMRSHPGGALIPPVRNGDFYVIPPGDVVIRVAATSKGRYVIKLGNYVNLNELPPNVQRPREWWQWEPKGPSDFVLEDEFDLLRVKLDPSIGALRLVGATVFAELVDPKGAVVGTSTATGNKKVPFGSAWT